MTFRTPEAAHIVIRNCLNRYDALVQQILQERSIRMLWFRFLSLDIQENLITNLEEHMNKETLTEENSLILLIKYALEPELNREALEERCATIPNMLAEVDRIRDSSTEYIIAVSDPLQMDASLRRVWWMTTGMQEHQLKQKLLDVLTLQVGLQELLTAYAEKLRVPGWQPQAFMKEVLAAELKKPNCRQCAASGKLLLCGRCKSARYCSSDCQKAHWNKHRPLCAAEKHILT